LLQKQRLAYKNLSPWYSADDRSPPAVLNVVSGYIVRLVFVTMFGVAIGFFTTSENVIANPVSSLGAPALAFLAGYGVGAVFRKLDGLAGQFSPGRK
jgi:hypothetical protein